MKTDKYWELAEMQAKGCIFAHYVWFKTDEQKLRLRHGRIFTHVLNYIEHFNEGKKTPFNIFANGGLVFRSPFDDGKGPVAVIMTLEKGLKRAGNSLEEHELRKDFEVAIKTATSNLLEKEIINRNGPNRSFQFSDWYNPKKTGILE